MSYRNFETKLVLRVLALSTASLFGCEATLSDAQFDDVKPLDGNVRPDSSQEAAVPDAATDGQSMEASLPDVGRDATPFDSGGRTCFECVPRIPAPSRTYTEGQVICMRDSWGTQVPVTVGIVDGLYFMKVFWRNQDGSPSQGCIDSGGCILGGGLVKDCLESGGLPRTDGDSFVVQDPRTGWRPNVGSPRTYCDGDRICTWNVQNRPLNVIFRNGVWKVETVESNQICLTDGARLLQFYSENSCLDDSGTLIPNYLYTCFPAYSPPEPGNGCTPR